MKFRTEYVAERGGFVLDPEVPVAGVGSCFSENVIRRMRRTLWDAVNPLSTLFNPLSIAMVLKLAICDSPEERRRILGESVFEKDGIYLSWLFDSKFASTAKEDLISRCILALDEMDGALKRGDLIVTFGTARCYFRGAEVVANCHKMPESCFVARRVSVDEIAEVWEPLCDALADRYPGIKVIFTVSPVRHVKDGFVENTRSKATLSLAVERIISGRGYCDYFPAYEILEDDLRDYRFYASDLVHPSEEGVEYIWEKFQQRYLRDKGVELLKEGERLWGRLNHRPIVAESAQTAKFIKDTERMVADFKAAHPNMKI